MPAYALDDFAFDLRHAVPPAHIWVGSGWTTVAPVPATVAGVGGWFAPPYAAPDCRLDLVCRVDGREVIDGGGPGAGDRGMLGGKGEWRPDRIVRHGTYHHYRDGTLVSIAMRTTLTPLYGRPGYLLEVVVRNRADRTVSVELLPRLTPGGTSHVPFRDWGWMPPAPGSNGPRLELVHAELSDTVAPGAERVFSLSVQAGAESGPVSAAHTTARWEQRVAGALDRVPRLSTDVPGLSAYYRRSLASGLVCLWDNPAFITNPFVATSGLDGGALCGYAWDTGGYAPTMLALMLGEGVTDVVEALMRADLTSHYAIAPDGTGLGVPYAYSGWSLIVLAYAAACQYGIAPDLVGRLHDAHAALDARFTPVGDLRDYGDHHNLLEMRGAGWEHVVASPNAERASSLEMLAELATQSGVGLPVAELRRTATAIRAAVRDQLWDADAGWFRSRYPDGHTELAYSIQAFDALRAGVCTPEMAKAMMSLIRDGAFLGRYGVSSVAATDEHHYELGDVDWSGGGAYSGEGPQLALTLWEQDEPDLAWQVLGRLLWMGEGFPYFPQEHYCDRPAAPPVGRRANVIAGLAGAEAIVTGLAGIRPQSDGSLLVAPHPVPDGVVELSGLVYRGRTVDVRVEPGRCQVTVDGREVSPGPNGDVLAVPAAALQSTDH